MEKIQTNSFENRINIINTSKKIKDFLKEHNDDPNLQYLMTIDQCPKSNHFFTRISFFREKDKELKNKEDESLSNLSSLLSEQFQDEENNNIIVYDNEKVKSETKPKCKTMYNCFDTNEEYFWEDLKRTVIQLLFYALLLSGWFFGMISLYWIIIAFFLKKTLIPNYNIAQKARKVINTFLSWSGIEKTILEFIQSFTSSKYMYLRTINVIFLPEPYQFRLFSPSEILSNDKTTFSIKGIKTILKQTNGDLKKIDENKLLSSVLQSKIIFLQLEENKKNKRPFNNSRKSLKPKMKKTI